MKGEAGIDWDDKRKREQWLTEIVQEQARVHATIAPPEKVEGANFFFPRASCQACPLRSQCVRGQGPRSISIQAEELVLFDHDPHARSSGLNAT